jgi:hypothetical protein
MEHNSTRILVLYWHPDPFEEMRVAIRDHLGVLENSSIRHEILYYNGVDGAPSWIRHCRPDAVLLHTTFLCLRWSHLFYEWKWKLRWVRDLDCVKIALPQDEYDHSEILDEWLFEWGVSIIFSNFDGPKRKLLYPIMHDKAAFYECFTGYIDESTAARSQQAFSGLSRAQDIVYRAAHLPYWFGSHGQLKHHIADVVSCRARAHGLRCDISTKPKDTLVGDAWLAFLGSGKAVIGCESGSSVLDRRGEIRAKIQALQRAQPACSFREISAQLPVGWDNYEFFAVSPRHFEAVITKTCQILIEGAYSGVLEPDKHYIRLRRDFSNLDEALEKVRDDKIVNDVVERAYHDIYLSGRYTYRTLAADILQALDECENRRPVTRTAINHMVWLLARMKSRLVTQSVKAHCRFDRFVQSVKQEYDRPI